eukprot:PhM_4_TR1680/c0_g1_i1/m.74850
MADQLLNPDRLDVILVINSISGLQPETTVTPTVEARRNLVSLSPAKTDFAGTVAAWRAEHVRLLRLRPNSTVRVTLFPLYDKPFCINLPKYTIAQSHFTSPNVSFPIYSASNPDKKDATVVFNVTLTLSPHKEASKDLETMSHFSVRRSTVSGALSSHAPDKDNDVEDDPTGGMIFEGGGGGSAINVNNFDAEAIEEAENMSEADFYAQPFSRFDLYDLYLEMDDYVQGQGNTILNLDAFIRLCATARTKYWTLSKDVRDEMERSRKVSFDEWMLEEAKVRIKKVQGSGSFAKRLTDAEKRKRWRDDAPWRPSLWGEYGSRVMREHQKFEKTCRRLFDSMDSDGSGDVTIPEAIEFCFRRIQDTQILTSIFFEVFDADNTGEIDLTEFRNILVDLCSEFSHAPEEQRSVIALRKADQLFQKHARFTNNPTLLSDPVTSKTKVLGRKEFNQLVQNERWIINYYIKMRRREYDEECTASSASCRGLCCVQ